MRDLGLNDPRKIGPYRLVGEIGRGGMGRVILALDPSDRLVAMKLILDEFLKDADFRGRFEREVRVSQRVQGEYIARTLGSDSASTPPWLVTEYVDGPTLFAVLSNHGPLSVDLTRRLGAFLAAALVDIHGAGLVHRDLTPSNIMFTDGALTVIDFGIARLIHDDIFKTKTSLIIGKYGYHSPEQLNQQPVTGASDIFTLGTVLAEASGGANPFSFGQPYEMPTNIASKPPHLSEVPSELRPIIERCLAKDPAARPTVDDLCREFGPPPSESTMWPAMIRDTIFAGRIGIADELRDRGFKNPSVAMRRRAEEMRKTLFWPSGRTARTPGQGDASSSFTPPPVSKPVKDSSRKSTPPHVSKPGQGGPRQSTPPRSPRESTVTPTPAWIAVAAVLTVIALLLWSDRSGKADDAASEQSPTNTITADRDRDSPTTSATTWSPPPDPEVFPDAEVGDCVDNYGDDDDIDLEFVSCGSGVFEVVGIRTLSRADTCWNDSDTDWVVTQRADNMGLCLMYRHKSSAYRAEVGDCVFRWDDDGPWSKETCETGVFKVIERIEGEDDLDACHDSYLLDWKLSLGSSYMDSLDRVYCLSIIYPDDIGHAPMDTCMLMTDRGGTRHFAFTECHNANVIVTGRTSNLDNSGFCGNHGSTAWNSHYFPDLSYRVCWNWY